jgi:hypothetical protein
VITCSFSYSLNLIYSYFSFRWNIGGRHGFRQDTDHDCIDRETKGTRSSTTCVLQHLALQDRQDQKVIWYSRCLPRQCSR